MNCWEILGIQNTSDIAAIKRAYAVKAKEWHPEEHPEEFKQLQQAYKTAVRLAKYNEGHSVQEVREPAKDKPAQNMASEDTAGHETTKQNATETEFVRHEEIRHEDIHHEEIRHEDIYKESTEHIVIIEKPAWDAEDIRKEPAEQITEHPLGEKVKQEDITEEIPDGIFTEDDSKPQELFDYEEVGEADLRDQFFGEFFAVAWNPYLINNLICWETILKRSPYDQLLSDAAFRSNFVRTACSIKGWKKKTIRFFQDWMQSRTDLTGDSGFTRETKLTRWKWNTMGMFEGLVSVHNSVTNDQKKMHDVFLSQLERHGSQTSLDNRESVEYYLSLYLPYAARNQSKLKAMYQTQCQGRTFLVTMIAGALAACLMAVYVNVYMLPAQKETAQKETIQKEATQKEAIKKEAIQKEAIQNDYVESYQEENAEKLAEIIREDIQEENAERLADTKAGYEQSQTGETCVVTYMYKGQIFNQTKVLKGKAMPEMEFGPAPRGRWDFDFSKEIEEDTTIEWIGGE